MKKVAIVYTEVAHYRRGFLDALAENYELTVVHSGRGNSEERVAYREIRLPVLRFGRFRFQTGLNRLLKNEKFDVVIFFLDLSWVSIVTSFLLVGRKSRRLTWGLWRTGRKKVDWARLLAARVADGNIFYSRSAAEDFLKADVPARKIWIGRNTYRVAAPGRDASSTRDTLLFVGSFDSRKQNEVTLRAFERMLSMTDKQIRLVFVGDGPRKEALLAQAEHLVSAGKVVFHEATGDPEKLRCFYSRAICSVSFGQAGLSVLQSFGHGVPFVTRRDAVSGGEIENIIDGFNGFLCAPDEDALMNVLLEMCSDYSLADRLGVNALTYYLEEASMDAMVAGFVGAIENSPTSALGTL